MKIPIYKVDVFTGKLFGGNPAAVCPLNDWLTDKTMQNIAMENNLSETAFIVKENDHYRIRWFTPTVEVDLCGHATLASAHVFFNYLDYGNNQIIFHSRSGELKVRKDGKLINLNFPSDIMNKIPVTEDICSGLGLMPVEAFTGKTDLMLVYISQEEIENIKPDFELISSIFARGIIVTAKGNDVDFVSRFFAPRVGVPEDPVTGSAHTSLIPYWSEKLNKTELTALQLSKRKGELKCKMLGDRVEIAGEAVTYMSGYIEI